jgi:hypothetical protein
MALPVMTKITLKVRYVVLWYVSVSMGEGNLAHLYLPEGIVQIDLGFQSPV